MQPAIRAWHQPLGAGRDQRRRFLLHHVPVALASAVVLVLFMSLPLFDVSVYPHADIVSGTFPQQRGDDHTGTMGHGGGHTGPGGVGARRPAEASPMGHGRDHAEAMSERGDHDRAMGREGDHSERGRSDAQRPAEAGTMGHGGGDTGPRDHGTDLSLTRSIQQFTVATGYVALGLLGLTLLIGPANLLLRRRVPVSNYLSRDVGAWTAIFSVVHVIVALLAHVSHGSALISSFLHFFVAPDGSLLTNSFGLGNWTGLAALVIVVGLLTISNDFALRKLKAKLWKRLQRLNYALFALVILHAFFYGALLRVTSPFTLLLAISVIAVLIGQAVGVWLWRQRYSRTVAKVA